MLRVARRTAVARNQVRPRGRVDRRLRRTPAVAGAAPDAGCGGGGALAVLRGLLRGLQRVALRRPHALFRRHAGGGRQRGRLSGRVSGTHLPARRAVHRSRVRAAPLGSGVRAGRRWALVVVARASRAARRGGARGSRGPGGGGPLRRRARNAAAGGRIRGADHVRLLVPAAPSAGRSAAGTAAGSDGTAAPAAARERPRPADGGRLGLALCGRSLG